jgi:hypothetical protein
MTIVIFSGLVAVLTRWLCLYGRWHHSLAVLVLVVENLRPDFYGILLCFPLTV